MPTQTKKAKIKSATAQFISKPGTTPSTKKVATVRVNGYEIPEGFVLKPEAKNKRVQILTTPTLFNHIKGIAERSGRSLNETINEALKQYIERENK